ncbi:MAG: hypothetical protein Kow0090_04140 [Myxococcota bacterium]
MPFKLKIPKIKVGKRFLKILAYSAIFILSFFVFLVFTFPSELIKNKIIKEVEDSTKGEMQIEKLSLSPLGISLENLILIIPPKGSSEKALRLDAKSLSARLALSQLFKGRLGLSFSAETMGGKLAGVLGAGDEDYDISLEFEDILIEKLAAMAEISSLKLNGKAGGELSLYYAKEIKERKGELSLRLNETVLSLGTVMGFEVPDIRLGRIETLASLNGNLFTLKELTAESDEISLKVDATGNINFKRPKSTSYEAHIALEAKELFWQKNPKLVVLKDLPVTKPYLRNDRKSYGLKLTGNLSRAPAYTPWKK